MAELLPPRSATDLFGDPIESQPLWFKAASFLRPDFDPESYIADLRSFVPLESLAAELRAHLAALKAELVDLINRDYADFVSLSTRLVDVDSAVAHTRAPLAEFRDKVAAFRAVVDSSLANLCSGLRQRAEASAAREILELLLDTFHVVSKVEKLIKALPTTASDLSTADMASIESSAPNSENALQHIESGAHLRETQSILLERIAMQNLPFIENMEERIQNATLLLDDSLGHCFVDSLEHQDANAIYNCLRAYAAIDDTSAAEKHFRTTIVSPLIQKIIPYSHLHVAGGVSSDGLQEDYQQIMQCIEKACKFILEISSTAHSVVIAISANSGLHVFDFLANSILKEVLFALQKGKPGAFSPGRPTEFQRNYKSSLGFLTFLEDCLQYLSDNILHNPYARFQEIAGALDSALMVTAITTAENLHDSQGKHQKLTLKQSITLMESLRSCWSDDVLVLSYSDKFLRLSLQLLSRYSSWLSSGLAARKVRSANLNPTPNIEWAKSAHVEDFIYVIHDVNFLVSELSGDYLRHVLQLLESCSAKVLDLVKQSILQAGKSLEDLLPPVMDTMIEVIVEKSVEDLRQLKGITATYRMTNKLPVRHSPYVSGILRPLKNCSLLINCINPLFISVCALCKSFVLIRYADFMFCLYFYFYFPNARNELLHGAMERITNRYYELASDLVSVARKTESSLLRLRQGAQRRVGASSDALDNNISDTEKICMQLFLDIQEYGCNLAAIGIKAADIPAYRSLWQCVAPEDKQPQIVF
ncbi:conserved oligomeric Golgi complex subunit 2 [Cocos nucifera]|uniref:Conserved oligomeric Golgi complex subunit 2 n=1 Tax=Cocos nucifera TaxID=13894 RepID=A0A8K0MWR4_COCNU|nr:conserved oligomeric Golgi complex subunit 2 [Cocos nucifera]